MMNLLLSLTGFNGAKTARPKKKIIRKLGQRAYQQDFSCRFEKQKYGNKTWFVTSFVFRSYYFNMSLKPVVFHPGSHWTHLVNCVFFEALKPTDRLCDFVTDGQELTALVVASVAGDFFCQVGGGLGSGSGGGWV